MSIWCSTEYIGFEPSSDDPPVGQVRSYVSGWSTSPIVVKILSRTTVDPQTGCWLWGGGCHPSGHGMIKSSDVHRCPRAHPGRRPCA